MSLMTRLGRRFREKPKPSNLNLPSLPTPREILEDIESCPNNDPIIALATIIQKKGRQSLLDSDFLEDTPSSPNTSQPQLAFLIPYQTSPADKSPEEPPPRPSKGKSATSHTAAHHGAPSKARKTDAEQINSYNKLKQFLLLYEKSEELLENLPPHFKRLETVLKSCDELALSTPEETLQDKESEPDVCSSPLM